MINSFSNAAYSLHINHINNLCCEAKYFAFHDYISHIISVIASFASSEKAKEVDNLSNIMKIKFLKKVKDYPVILKKRMEKDSSGKT